jgi:hypothetical protein
MSDVSALKLTRRSHIALAAAAVIGAPAAALAQAAPPAHAAVPTKGSAALRRAYLAELQKQHPPILNELALSGLFDNSEK